MGEGAVEPAELHWLLGPECGPRGLEAGKHGAWFVPREIGWLSEGSVGAWAQVLRGYCSGNHGSGGRGGGSGVRAARMN